MQLLTQIIELSYQTKLVYDIKYRTHIQEYSTILHLSENEIL